MARELCECGGFRDKCQRYGHINEHGTETFCPVAQDGKHAPNWGSLSTSSDGGEIYLDIGCEHCGRGGCVAALKKIEQDINW